MWTWLERALDAMPAEARAQVVPHLMRASAKVMPVWIKLKARGAQLGSLSAAAPEVLAPTLRALYRRLQDDPEAIARAVGPLWDVARKLLAQPEVRANLHHLAAQTLNVASDQFEAALRWMDSPRSTRALGEGLTALERFIGAWLNPPEDAAPAPGSSGSSGPSVSSAPSASSAPTDSQGRGA